MGYKGVFYTWCEALNNNKQCSKLKSVLTKALKLQDPHTKANEQLKMSESGWQICNS